jgi:hypothetical protein
MFGEAEDPVDEVKLTTAANLPTRLNVQSIEDQSNMTSNAKKQLFASSAANNYYNAIQQLNASKRNSFVEASGRKSAMDNRSSLSEVKCRDKSKTSGGNKKDWTKKKDKKLTLEQLVAKALSIPFTPKEKARYSLAQDDEKHNGSDEKNTMHDGGLYEDEELSLTTEIVSSHAIVSPIACPPVASFDNNESDEKNTLHDGVLYKDEEPSLNTEIVPTPAKVSPIACPPAASFDNYTVKTEIVSPHEVVLPAACPLVASFNIEMKPSTLSAASSITNHSSCDGNKITTKDASSVEKYAEQKVNPDRGHCPWIAENPTPDCCPEEENLVYPKSDLEFNMVDTCRESELGYIAPTSNEKKIEPVMEESIEEVLEDYLTKSANSTACVGNLREESKIGSKPPLIDPITQALRVNDVLSAIGVAPGLCKKSSFTRSESPSFFKKKKIETVGKDEVKASMGELGPSEYPRPTSSSTIKNALHSARSMSPSFFLPPKSDVKPTSKSSSDCSTTTASTGSASAETGPRMILLAQTSADDSFNIEEDIISVPATNPKIKRNFKPMVPSRKDIISESRSSALPPRMPSRGVSCDPPRQHLMQQIVTNPADDGTVECSVMKNEEILQLTEDGDAAVASLCYGLNSSEITQQDMNTHTTVTIEKNNSSDDDVIVQVLASIKSEPPTVACHVAMTNEKPAFHQSFFPAHELAAPPYEEDNNATISSSAESQKRNEKLKKIMDYRKITDVAHPTQKSSKGTSFQNTKNNKKIETRTTEISFFPEDEATKGLRENVLKIDRSVKEKWPAPVQRIDVFPNAFEYDDADDNVSLPPELETGKIKIWQEDGSIDSEASVARNGRDTKLVVDSYVMCGEISCSDTDVFDTNTLIGNTVYDDNESTGDETKYGGRFACGIEIQELKDEISFEVKDLARDIEFGLRHCFQNLFGTCDITRDGGVEYLRANVGIANDQLFGRASMPSASSMQKSIPRCMDAASQNHETGHTQSAASNKQKLYVARLKELSLKHV